MIDLHIHTTFSDGCKKPIEILEMAQKLNLKYISITDHDTCDAYADLDKIDVLQYYTGKIITGCEISTCFDGTVLEILAYGIDWKPLSTWLNTYYSQTQIELRERKIFDKIKQLFLNHPELQISTNLDLPMQIPYSGYFKFMLYNNILKYESNNKFLAKNNIKTYEDFLRKGLYNKSSSLYFNHEDFLANAKTIVDLIHKIGGLAFVAHIYKLPISNPIDYLQKMLDNKIDLDGIEVNYSSFSQQQEKELTHFCKQNHLYMSGGSDYHGLSTRKEQLGFGTAGKRISQKYIKDWYKKI